MNSIALADRDIDLASLDEQPAHRDNEPRGRLSIVYPARKAGWQAQAILKLLAQECVELLAPEVTDLAVFPGSAASSGVRSAQHSRLMLSRLIDKLSEDGFAFDADHLERVSPPSRDAANAVVNLLPDEGVFPKIAPDGEGAIALHFETGESHVIVIVDGWNLHLVRNAATPEAEYFDDIPFDGVSLPQQLIGVLGNRLG